MITHVLCLFSLFLGIVPTGPWEVPHPSEKGVDKSITSFGMKQKPRIDLFDFSGEYVNLQDIDIDGKRLKEVEMLLTGTYPVLKSISFDGGLGSVDANLTGEFPVLEKINFVCNAAALKLDLTGQWKQDCSINIDSLCGEVNLILPKDVGVVVYSKNGLWRLHKGELKKKGWLKNKHYFNELYEKAPITLHINIVAKEGHVTLN